MTEPRLLHLFHNFYTVERVGAAGLSDGGGPFGFDIGAAIQIDYLLDRFQCDAFVEAGTFLGDTTLFVARNYPNLRVLACDINERYAEFTRIRLRGQKNASVRHMDSRELVRSALQSCSRPFFYLDAHWYDDWPLSEELALIDRGIVCIDDFDIGHERFAFDTYEGRDCGPGMLAPHREKFPNYFINNPTAAYPFPCLQVGRRGGKCYLGVEGAVQALEGSDYFLRRSTPPREPLAGSLS